MGGSGAIFAAPYHPSSLSGGLVSPSLEALPAQPPPVDLLAATSPSGWQPGAPPPSLASSAATSLRQRPVTLLPDPRSGLAGGRVSPGMGALPELPPPVDLTTSTSPPGRRPEAQPPPPSSTAATSSLGKRPALDRSEDGASPGSLPMDDLPAAGDYFGCRSDQALRQCHAGRATVGTSPSSPVSAGAASMGGSAAILAAPDHRSGLAGGLVSPSLGAPPEQPPPVDLLTAKSPPVLKSAWRPPEDLPLAPPPQPVDLPSVLRRFRSRLQLAFRPRPGVPRLPFARRSEAQPPLGVFHRPLVPPFKSQRLRWHCRRSCGSVRRILNMFKDPVERRFMTLPSPNMLFRMRPTAQPAPVRLPVFGHLGTWLQALVAWTGTRFLTTAGSRTDAALHSVRQSGEPDILNLARRRHSPFVRRGAATPGERFATRPTGNSSLFVDSAAQVYVIGAGGHVLLGLAPALPRDFALFGGGVNRLRVEGGGRLSIVLVASSALPGVLSSHLCHVISSRPMMCVARMIRYGEHPPALSTAFPVAAAVLASLLQGARAGANAQRPRYAGRLPQGRPAPFVEHRGFDSFCLGGDRGPLRMPLADDHPVRALGGAAGGSSVIAVGTATRLGFCDWASVRLLLQVCLGVSECLRNLSDGVLVSRLDRACIFADSTRAALRPPSTDDVSFAAGCDVWSSSHPGISDMLAAPGSFVSSRPSLVSVDCDKGASVNLASGLRPVPPLARVDPPHGFSPGDNGWAPAAVSDTEAPGALAAGLQLLLQALASAAHGLPPCAPLAPRLAHVEPPPGVLLRDVSWMPAAVRALSPDAFLAYTTVLEQRCVHTFALFSGMLGSSEYVPPDISWVDMSAGTPDAALSTAFGDTAAAITVVPLRPDATPWLPPDPPFAQPSVLTVYLWTDPWRDPRGGANTEST